VAASRIGFRFYHEFTRGVTDARGARVLIVGAGDVGEAVLREILRSSSTAYDVVGFLDDDPAKVKHRIHGVEVLGPPETIRETCESLEADEVLIALPGASPKRIRALVEQCAGMALRFRTIPAVTDLIEGRVQVSQIRAVDIADLLGRDPVCLDTDAIGKELTGRRILVTGAGGSIGSEMCRQITRFCPDRLILVEQAENNLFEIHRELVQDHPELDIVPLVADICDETRLRAIFDEHRPHSVFHAAAHKHVPMMELNPGEAIKNNVVGTRVVAVTAAEFDVQKMVMISTDKAVNPTSIMGCTKRVAEMFVQQFGGRCRIQFVTVRFGNVLGSSGSVIPIFERQIAAGGPVTVTHPDMTRYFMTIPEAAQLVLQAGTMGHGGEIYVLDMGEPVKIVDLAYNMITLSGLRPDEDIEIVFSGTRPGEKLFEELLVDGEHVMPTSHPKIAIWKSRPEDWKALTQAIEHLVALADGGTPGQIREQLARIVPEYRPGEPGGETAAPAFEAQSQSVAVDE
jgi:FlaA1/EpsC-like NDP-sugar epimerase